MERMNELLCSVVLPAFLAGSSVFFFLYLRGAPFRRAKKERLPHAGRSSAFRAVSMALAGTLGVGNITGVADALRKGGAGVLFWMWVSAFAAMVIKFVEIILLMRTKRTLAPTGAQDPPGPMQYMRPTAVGMIFCLFGLSCGFTVGGALQSTAVAGAGAAFSGLSPLFFCLFLGCPAAFFIFRGKRSLFALTSVFVPMMSLLYVGLCTAVIVKNAQTLPGVFRSIFEGAFGKNAALQGGRASLLTALRYGIIRGLISNEAGCGTAPIAHAHSTEPSVRQARLGVLEVAVDTLILCTLTGLTLLTVPDAIELSPTNAVARALSPLFGGASDLLLFAALYVFAFATLLCWSLYIDCFSSYLFRRSKRKQIASRLLRLLFCLCACFSFLLPEEWLWRISDLSVAMMTLINLFFLLRKRKEIRDECAV